MQVIVSILQYILVLGSCSTGSLFEFSQFMDYDSDEKEVFSRYFLEHAGEVPFEATQSRT